MASSSRPLFRLSLLCLLGFTLGGFNLGIGSGSGSVWGRQDDQHGHPAVAPEDAAEGVTETLPGHSYHGDAFNEGPRQQAYLMGGTGDVDFPITSDHPEAQAFFNQGIGQLHGFWDLEAERTFRQVISLDRDCAMAYWGAALATIRNADRSGGFIAEAVKRKEKVTPREQQYIEALRKYIEDKSDDKKKRAAEYLKDLESIALEYPDDLEAKALIVHRIWQNGREGIPVASYIAADALLQDIYEQNPRHPAHHYTIHLWDYRKPEKAVQSAELCGISAPRIAHMWHMPGHIYSRLKQYETAVYQQEASARVDHHHMIQDRVMPDEIHNYAHNNEWLIRNLVYVGRVHDALDLAANMTELPQHPKYNSLDKQGGSASYGRRRLLQVLREYQLFDEAVSYCQSSYLRVSAEQVDEEIKRLRLLGSAAAMTGQNELAETALSDLQWIHDQQASERDRLQARIRELDPQAKETAEEDESEAGDEGEGEADPNPPAKAEEGNPEGLAEAKGALKKIRPRLKQIEQARSAIEGYRAAAAADYSLAHEKLDAAKGEDLTWLAELQVLSGKVDEGLKQLDQQVKRRPQEVIPLARLAWAAHHAGQTDRALKAFQQLRDTSGSMDLDVPLFARLESVAQAAGLAADWRKPPAVEIGTEIRPPLDQLGPFRWQPPQAPDWALRDGTNIEVASSAYDGRAKLLIFFLGHGCLHCADQLKAFGPRVADFQAAGIDIITISTDDVAQLGESITNYGTELPFQRLLSDANLEVFKKYRAYDDFEQQPLHGTFLIDGQNRIRWQDISYEPFMDHEFLFVESQRLLNQELPEGSTVQRGPETPPTSDTGPPPSN